MYLLMLVFFFIFVVTPILVLSSCSLSFTLRMGQTFVVTADSYSLIFMNTLSCISVTVLTWSYYYIDSELEYRRFFGLVLLFLCSIILLVFSADLLSLFVAWDLLGFTSFFLVVFFRSRSSLGGGVLTGLTNRIGDVLLLAYFGLCSYSCDNLCFGPVLLILLVSFTKSAQSPFSAWLPAAMLAPTPVSAIVHSSTLVTAGVYLLFRFLGIECRALSHVGLFTLLLAGMAAAFEADLKKLVALSTLSQLGLIMLSIGLGLRSLSFAHLNSHAVFKALLFIAIGTVIHTYYGGQESRSCAALSFASPLVLVTASVSSLSLVGLPFLSGGITKEAILEAALNRARGTLFVYLFYFGISLTVAYCFRLCSMLLGTRLMDSRCFASVSAPLASKLPIFTLLLLSIVSGSTSWAKTIIFPSLLRLSDKLIVL